MSNHSSETNRTQTLTSVSRVYSRNSIMSTVGQHGSFYVRVVHLHHEGTRDACAFLQSWGGLEILILLSNTHALTVNAELTVQILLPFEYVRTNYKMTLSSKMLCLIRGLFFCATDTASHSVLLLHWWDSSWCGDQYFHSDNRCSWLGDPHRLSYCN